MRPHSPRVVPVISRPDVVIYPVHFPGFASVFRERLLETTVIQIGSCQHPAHEDRSALERFLVIELSPALLELSGHGLSQGAVVTGSPDLAPLTRLGIIQPQR